MWKQNPLQRPKMTKPIKKPSNHNTWTKYMATSSKRPWAILEINQICQYLQISSNTCQITSKETRKPTKDCWKVLKNKSNLIMRRSSNHESKKFETDRFSTCLRFQKKKLSKVWKLKRCKYLHICHWCMIIGKLHKSRNSWIKVRTASVRQKLKKMKWKRTCIWTL